MVFRIRNKQIKINNATEACKYTDRAIKGDLTRQSCWNKFNDYCNKQDIFHGSYFSTLWDN